MHLLVVVEVQPMIWDSIVTAYIQFFWMALFASAVGAILVATMDQHHAEVRRHALQH